MSEALELVLILLASAVLVVVVFRSVHLPPLLGYLIVGAGIGPHALGWVADVPATRQLAEFGVVFLMFTLGLEFSLPRLVQMRGLVFGLGAAQVLLTMVVLAPLAIALGATWQAAVMLAGALAMSSTAIVIRLLVERLETETPHGRGAIGVLLFQDLAVVPLLILVPALAGTGETLARDLATAALKAAVVLAIVLTVGQRLMRPWFTLVARRKSHELFIINVLFITLGLAYLTERAGLSLALGAFVAGMLISETQYRHQVEEDIKPFREVLLGLFFISMGMQLDLAVVARELPLVLAVFAVPMALKFALVAALSRLRGATPGTAIRSGLALAQARQPGDQSKFQRHRHREDRQDERKVACHDPQVELHAHRDEEQAQQHLAEGLDVLLDLVPVLGLRNQHSGDERTEGERQAGELREVCEPQSDEQHVDDE